MSAIRQTKRKYDRIKDTVLLDIYVSGAFEPACRACLTDISLGGAGFESTERLPLGERINLVFALEDGKEYIITNPDTPRPWINYLTNENYCSVISQTAGGYSFYKDARFRRLTRYRYNNVPWDNGGKYFYIQDGDCVWYFYHIAEFDKILFRHEICFRGLLKRHQS